MSTNLVNVASHPTLEQIKTLPWWGQLVFGIGFITAAYVFKRLDDRYRMDLVLACAISCGIAGVIVTLGFLVSL